MVSRRTFISITMMMAVLFFLFVFSGVVKENWNDYETNEYVNDNALKKDSAWKAEIPNGEEADVIFFGKQEQKGVCQVVRQWCGYTKRSLKIYEKAGAYKLNQDKKPQVMIIDSSTIDFNKELPSIRSFADAGVNMIFSGVPQDLATLEKNQDLCQILGIRNIIEKSVKVEGIKLFSGFLLGGEVIYQAHTNEEKKQQDLELEIPWFTTTTGTKTYMVGLLDEDEDIDNEYYPGIIWRNSYEDARVFVVNGDYLCDNAGIGILSAMITEMKSYDLYPIINSQSMSVLNYPGFANENDEVMKELYSRPQSAVCKEVIWQNLSAVSQANKLKITCLFSPQLDYEDGISPDATDLEYYLKVFKEQNAELGLSTERIGNTSLSRKLEEDKLFWDVKGLRYQMAAYYAAPGEIKALTGEAGSDAAPGLHTITSDYEANEELLCYLDDDVTLQRATIDSFSHAYSEDIRVRSLETALGYSNMMANMQRVLWPKEEADRWEKLSDYFARYTTTYWKPFSQFDKTTLSEGDCRLRCFLALDYEESREADEITLNIDHFEEEAWFILRTHDEEITKLSGGVYELLEKDVYLIHADSAQVTIQLKENDIDNTFYLD